MSGGTHDLPRYAEIDKLGSRYFLTLPFYGRDNRRELPLDGYSIDEIRAIGGLFAKMYGAENVRIEEARQVRTEIDLEAPK